MTTVNSEHFSRNFSNKIRVKSHNMRFSAKITTEEERYDTSSTAECVSTTHFQITTGYEMESIQRTINLRPKNRRASSVPNFRRKSGLLIPTKERVRKKRDPTFTEEEELELCRIGMGMGYGSDERRKEEEELRKKMMRKPSRKVSREGNYVLIQIKVSNILVLL